MQLEKNRILVSFNGKKMKRNFKKVSPIGLAIALCMSLVWVTGCNKSTKIEGKTYYYQCYWEGGPNDFSPYGEFKSGGVFVHHDDTATIQGTWNNVEETVTWVLNNPPKNTRFRGTFDRKHIDGNITDDLGHKAFFQGGCIAPKTIPHQTS
jgi:hypothetical protein